MSNRYPRTIPLEKRLENRLARKRSDVFMREDFEDLGGYDQVGRALKNLIAKGQLIRVGYGLYVRTRLSILDGSAIPVKSMKEVASEALGRLGVETFPSSYEAAYNSGRSTQVPNGRVLGVTSRVRRKISYNGTRMSFERVEPTPR